jgi:hypothetical protein
VNGDNDAEDNHEDDSAISFKQSESYNEADAANFKNAEADLLLDMQSAQAYAYATPSSATGINGPHHDSGRETVLNLLSSGGDDGTHSALNVSAMAASLNQLPLSQRLMIPRHLAATLVVNGDDDEEDTEEEKEQDKVFREEEDESVPSATRDTVVPVTPVDSTAVRVVATTPSEESTLDVDVPKSSEQQRESNNRREASHPDDPVHPPKVVDVDVSAAADQRRRNLIQRASVTSPIDLMGQGTYDDDDDDVITRLRRREMEGSPREGDPRAFSPPSVSDTAKATAPIEANISTATIIDCTGENEDVDQWLESALGSEPVETDNVEGEGELDDWLDGVIE